MLQWLIIPNLLGSLNIWVGYSLNIPFEVPQNNFLIPSTILQKRYCKLFYIIPQLCCSCHAAKASTWNSQKKCLQNLISKYPPFLVDNVSSDIPVGVGSGDLHLRR